jgi:signal transduction histidine kinase
LTAGDGTDPLDAGVVWSRVLWWTYAIAGGLYILSRGASATGDTALPTLTGVLVVVASAAPLVWVTARYSGILQRTGFVFWFIAYALAVAGTSVGASVWWLIASRAGLSARLDVALLLDVVVVGPIWIGLIGSGVSLWQWGRWRRQRLRSMLAEIAAMQEAEVDAARAFSELAEQEVHASLAAMREGLAAAEVGDDADRWRSVARDLRAVAQDVVRPLSHGLADSATAPPSMHSGPVSWVRQIITREDFRPVLVAAVFVAGAITPHVRDYGWVTGLGLLVAEVLVIFVIMGAANVAMSRVRHRAWVYVATILVLQVIPLLPWPQLLGETEPPTVAERIAATVASVLLILVTSGIGLVTSRRDRRLEVLEDVVAVAARRGSADAIRIAAALRELATVLHGRVQATLTSTSLAIESAVAEGRWADARAALDRVLTLARPDSWREPVSNLDLRGRLDQVCLPWRAVGEVTVEVDGDWRSASEESLTAVTRVVEEAVTNAFRHGLASNVIVLVACDGDGIVVRVTDDGQGIAGPTTLQRGFGLAAIDEMTSGCWSIVRETDRTEFRARLVTRL